jgi:hypothetical protein
MVASVPELIFPQNVKVWVSALRSIIIPTTWFDSTPINHYYGVFRIVGKNKGDAVYPMRAPRNSWEVAATPGATRSR